jgi:hypothetical protein
LKVAFQDRGYAGLQDPLIGLTGLAFSADHDKSPIELIEGIATRGPDVTVCGLSGLAKLYLGKTGKV